MPSPRRLALIILAAPLVNACSYKFGLSNRALPGGYTRVAIPMFKNDTREVGLETVFTNALVRRFARSQVADVVDQDASPVVLEGNVHELKVTNGPGVTNQPNQLPLLPQGVVLTTEYRLAVTTKIQLRRRSDDKIVWEGSFTNERVYQAPRLGTPVVNSANATYNQSVRTHTLALVADDMMSEAHDRITENF